MKKRRFSRTDWIKLGLARLADAGSEAVKLEAICEAAGLTRGSFYHHFDDHRAFTLALAEHWFDTQPLAIAEQIDEHGVAEAQASALTDAALQIDYRLELGIRELARRLDEVAVIVRKADALRVDTLAGIYQNRFRIEQTAARDFALLEYAAFSGVLLLDPDMPIDKQAKLAELYDRTVTRALNSE
ncbi:MAG: TetR/AcrR family transcriptional regulator [Pseudomonadota bacterium]